MLLLLPTILSVVVLLEPGSCFLFKKRSQDQETPASVPHLRSRYWNDDIQPCIEKYCLSYQGKKAYIRCLQHFCPAGLLAVPRDLEMSTLPVTMMLSDTEFCTDDALNSNSLATDYSEFISDDIESNFVYGVYKLCRSTLCKETRGSLHTACVRERCCGQTESKRYSALKKRSPDVNQCIMSYCNDVPKASYVTCILRHCHRM